METHEYDGLSLEEIKAAIKDVEDDVADLDTELQITFGMDHRHIAPAEANAELGVIRRDKEKLLQKKQKLLAALSKKLGERT